MEKSFHIGDILSITTHRLVSLRHMDGISDILNFMTGKNLFAHQLLNAADECRPFLFEQFPQLNEVDSSGVTPENWRNWLDEQVSKFGKELSVHTITDKKCELRDPLRN